MLISANAKLKGGSCLTIKPLSKVGGSDWSYICLGVGKTLQNDRDERQTQTLLAGPLPLGGI